ncbi:transposase [Planoprotostelium fungivorum]|uniref:Transposase n=1 Tax=Planoprotostelium fungivorum TaxID=1890364 RepID=A0A2P6MNG0_9EUKA|nr:transposase [Planoprotostelium fungivorum]
MADSWNNRHDVGGIIAGQKTIAIAINATVCPIQSPMSEGWESQKMWYSRKHGIHCLKYKVAVRIIDGQIVWVNGSVPGSMHDSLLCTLGGIEDGLLENEGVLGDSAYRSAARPWAIASFKTPRGGELTPEQRNFNKYVGRHRVIVERVFSRMKEFAILTHPFRAENYQLHELAFQAIVKLHNYNIVRFP